MSTSSQLEILAVKKGSLVAGVVRIPETCIMIPIQRLNGYHKFGSQTKKTCTILDRIEGNTFHSNPAPNFRAMMSSTF